MNIDFSQVVTAETQRAQQDEALRNSQRAECVRLLQDTDWYVVRQLETGKAVPEDIARQRAEARRRVDTPA